MRLLYDFGIGDISGPVFAAAAVPLAKRSWKERSSMNGEAVMTGEAVPFTRSPKEV